jgi:hypothetical protein
MIKPNVIEEIHSGHYWVLLDFPLKDIVLKLLSPEYKYVWLIDYQLNYVVWERPSLFEIDKDLCRTFIRKTQMEMLMETADFIKMFPKMQGSLHIVQVNKIPPFYMNHENMKGKTWFQKLKEECDYYFEIKLPSVPDYAEMISPDKNLLEKASKIE